jgi:hypothetical protein
MVYDSLDCFEASFVSVPSLTSVLHIFSYNIIVYSVYPMSCTVSLMSLLYPFLLMTMEIYKHIHRKVGEGSFDLA